MPKFFRLLQQELRTPLRFGVHVTVHQLVLLRQECVHLCFFKSCNRCRSLFAMSFFDPPSASSSSSSLSSPVYRTSANLTMNINSKSAVHGSETDDSPHPENANTLQLPMHEVTFSTIDKSKLLSKMSALLRDVGLNIREAHVF